MAGLPAGRVERLVLGMIVAGTAARLVLAFTTYGARFDVGAYRVVYEALRHHGLHAYSAVNVRQPTGAWLIHWPYLPGFMPWTAVAREVQLHAGLAFHTVIKLPAVAADGAIAWVVFAVMRARGRSSAEQLAACALVALGPAFAFISGYHGQIDAVAVLPALLAVYGWERWPPRRRAVWCGLLIGLAGAIKPIPFLALVPLLIAASSWRERVTLVVSGLTIPVLLVAPFAIADPHGVATLTKYSGFPGLGGVSLAVQPSFVLRYLRGPVTIGGPERFLIDHGRALTLVATAAVALVMARARPWLWEAEHVLFLAFFVLFPFYARSYLVWVLPFIIAAGHLRLAAVLQLLGFGAAIATFYLPGDAVLQLTLLMALLAAAALGAVIAVFRAWRRRPPRSRSDRRTAPGLGPVSARA